MPVNQTVTTNTISLSAFITIILIAILALMLFVKMVYYIADENNKETKYDDTNRQFKIFIKIIIITALILFALYDYRIFSFGRGFSKNEYNERTIVENISRIINIEKIEYYETETQNSYMLYIQTSDEAHLTNVPKEIIGAYTIGGQIIRNVKPTRIYPIPYCVEAFIIFTIIILPTRRRITPQKESEKIIHIS